MITLSQLFNYGDIYYENSNLLWDFVVNFVGIFFSFITAYAILKLQIYYDKKKERKKNEESLHSHYNLIKELITDTISTSIKQIENIKEFIKKLKENPFQENCLYLLIFSELKRFQKLENEMTFKSFMYKLNSLPEKNTIYKNIYNSMDYIEKSIEIIEKSYSDLLDTYDRLQLKYKDKVDEISNRVQVFIGSLNRTNKPELEVFNSLLIQQDIFISLSKEPQDIDVIDKKYLQPIRELIVDKLTNIPECINILVKTKEAGIIIGDLKYEAQKKAEFFVEEAGRFSEVIAKLRVIIDRIS